MLSDKELKPRMKERSEMAFTPLHDRVLVRRVESDEKTAGGLFIPESAKEKPAEAEVVSVGEGARKDSGELIPMSVKAGDKVLFGKWSGTEVTVDGEELLIMKESDILGLIG
jgi:chaperonin GroES